MFVHNKMHNSRGEIILLHPDRLNKQLWGVWKVTDFRKRRVRRVGFCSLCLFNLEKTSVMTS